VLSDFYDLHSVSKKVMGDFNKFMETGDVDKLEETVDRYSTIIGTYPTTLSIRRQVKALRDLSHQIFLATEDQIPLSKKNEMMRKINDARNALQPAVEKIRSTADLPANPLI
jgi:uncharacterized coiled-coil DUF342 family protein